MPPRKRTRAAATASKANSTGNANKKAKKPADLPPLPPKQAVDTYRPDNEESKKQIASKVQDLISKTAQRLKFDTVGHFQLRLSISNTEGDLLLGKDGKSNIEKIQKLSNTVLVVTDKVVAGVDREVIVTGGLKEITIATIHISYFLSNVLETGTVDTIYHVTLLVSNNFIESVGIDKLKKLIPTIDVSTIFAPFSNYQSVYLYGRISQLMSSLATLLESISSVSLKQQLFKDFPPEPFPIIGLQSGSVIRSEINQKLLDRSKQSFARYLSQDYKEERSQQVDPKQHTQKQIEEALKECQKKSKTLETLKHAIDVPVDYISAIIGKNGLKITEIRSKSNSNVIIDDQIKNNNYKVVTITGLPESNLTALQYIAGLIV